MGTCYISRTDWMCGGDTKEAYCIKALHWLGLLTSEPFYHYAAPISHIMYLILCYNQYHILEDLSEVEIVDFTHIFEKHYKYIYAYAYKLTHSKERAEDLTQETFLKAYEKQHQLKNLDLIKYWLRSICFNTYLMFVRKQGTKEVSCTPLLELQSESHKLSIDEKPPSVEKEIIVDEALKHIQNGCFLTMVHLLTLNQRIIFSFVDMFGLNISEAANVLGITQSAAKALLHRARIKLDNFFLNYCGLFNDTNPCNCRAWEDFVLQREKIKQAFIEGSMSPKKSIDEKTMLEERKKIRHLYATMPNHIPSEEWYKNVLAALRKLS